MYTDQTPGLMKVKLKFPSTADLWEFVQLAPLKEVEIDSRRRCLSCVCTEETIELAVRKYRARTVKGNRRRCKLSSRCRALLKLL